jgi:hypothetical protein
MISPETRAHIALKWNQVRFFPLFVQWKPAHLSLQKSQYTCTLPFRKGCHRLVCNLRRVWMLSFGRP